MMHENLEHLIAGQPDFEVFSHPDGQKEEKERTTWYSLRPLMNDLFPNTRNTAIPLLVEELVDGVARLSEPSDPDHERFFLRGNPTIRRVLGTPPGYWEIPRAYRSIEGFDPFVGENSALAAMVVEHLASGPDMDIMLQKKQGVSDQDVLAWIDEWAGDITRRFPRLHVGVSPVPLNVWNGEEDPRVYSQVTFSLQQRRGMSESVFRIDIGEAPNNETSAMDGRLSIFVTSIDMASVAGLRKKGDHWYAVVDATNKRALRNHPIRVFGSGAQPGNKAVVATRLMTQWLLYQRDTESLQHFVLRQLQHWHPRSKEWDLPSLPFGGSGYWDAVSVEHLPKIERREGDVACQAILGLTIDPYAWIELAASLGLLKKTKLGVILEDARMWIALTRSQADPHLQPLCDNFRLAVVELLSKDYRWSLLLTLDQPYYLGPLQLVRRLKQIGALTSDTPETIATAIDLINPAAFLRQQGVIFQAGHR